MRSTIALGLFLTFVPPEFAQSQADVAGILKRVSAVYTGISRYELEANVTAARATSGATNPSSHMLIAFQAPDRYRMEGVLPNMRFTDAGFGGKVIVVSDGSGVWFYMSKSNQYGFVPASVLIENAVGDWGDLRPEAVDNFMMSRYRTAADFRQGARLLREERINFAGKNVDCYVLSLPQSSEGPASRWWVDAETYHVLRADEADSSAVFTAINLDEPLPAELFKFEPPPGAHQIRLQY